jgi:hypothetical protein
MEKTKKSLHTKYDGDFPHIEYTRNFGEIQEKWR